LIDLGRQRLGDLDRNPDRVVVGGGELGGGVGQDQALVRSGRVAAKKIAVGPASISASSAARSAPTSSRTAARSWA